jgi:hypothetical protein
MVYTLGQAAKATGRSKSTILKAIKNGRISARKSETGDWEIDPSELHRLYPPSLENGSPEHSGARQETPSELIELRVKNEALREQNTLLRDERDDLRRRLDQSEDERRHSQAQLTALLTDQRQKEEPPPSPPRGFWQRLWNAKISL